jgi:tetratricopeptide (TPR) repeat protein
MNRVLYILSIATVGFLAGWWANDTLSPEPPDKPEAAPGAIASPAAPVRSSPATAPPSQPTEIDFTRLLAAGDIESAMQVYDALSAGEPAQATRLRAAVLDALEQKLAQGDGETLQLLADAWLWRYYDDTDVLLILAEFQRQLGYPDEAARVLQFAATYAHQPVQRDKVATYTRLLVQKTDAKLAGESRWIELLGFYHLLESIGLSTPEYRLGQAQVSLELGDYDTARELLEPLTDNAALASRAAGLLAQLDQSGSQSTSRPPRSDGIALQRLGGHYLVPVRFIQ